MLYFKKHKCYLRPTIGASQDNSTRVMELKRGVQDEKHREQAPAGPHLVYDLMWATSLQWDCL